MEKRRRREFLAGSVAAAGALVSASVVPVRAARNDRPSTKGFLEAVARGDLDAVRQGLDIDPGLLHSRDGDGRTAFAVALVHYQRGIADLLRERGYRPDLHESALALDWERFESLARDEPERVNRDHPIGGTTMYAAALGGAGRSMWRVYRAGGQPNVAPRGPEGYTPVRAALEHPDLARAELAVATLLGNGASPGGAQRGGSSPLHVCARRGSLETVELLLRKAADVEARDAGGRTALDLAEEARHREVANLLRRHRDVPRDHHSSRSAYDVDGHPYAPPDLGTVPVSELIDLVGHAHRNLDVVRERVDRQPALAHAQATTTEGAVEAGAHMGRLDIVEGGIQRLPPQPARLLALLADRGGELVGREEIRGRIWRDVEVDFDQSLHFCVRQIRTALGDSATEPRYVENLPRRGYRLMLPVERIGDDGSAAQGGRTVRRLGPWAVGLLVAVVAIAAWLAPRRLAVSPETPLRIGIMTFTPPGQTNVFGDPAPIADRILEELTTRAGERAQIVGPSTTAGYTDVETSLRELITDYDLDYVVNGRFLEGEDGPRMLAELIRASDGAHVWVRAYTDLQDDRRVGSEITRAVLAELELAP